jgi:hypothetical protein
MRLMSVAMSSLEQVSLGIESGGENRDNPTGKPRDLPKATDSRWHRNRDVNVAFSRERIARQVSMPRAASQPPMALQSFSLVSGTTEACYTPGSLGSLFDKLTMRSSA